MSRSIHANASLRQLRQRGETDWEAMRRKRDIKDSVLRDRHAPDLDMPFTDAKDVPIRQVDSSPWLYFPVTEDDLRAVLEALPRGVTTGLVEIRLEIGRSIINDLGGRYDWIDPAFGRLSVEDLPGVFVPKSMGVYQPRSQTIRLFGYTKSPKLKLSRRQQILMALQFLSTLVHEVVHHHDWMHRMAAGRHEHSYWDKGEAYTEQLTQRWVLDAVLPHLRAQYGEADTLRLTRLVLKPRGPKRWRNGRSRGERSRYFRARLARDPKFRWQWLQARRRRPG